MRRARGLLSMLLAGAASCAGEAASTPDGAASEPPTGYATRLDSDRSDASEFRLSEEEGGLRIVTGPAGIAYRPEDRVASGDFRAQATFVQYEAPVGYREAYGVFVGGRELSGPDYEYTYLLVRPTGDYLVKRRIGEITEIIVDWTPDDAVRRVDVEGDEPENTLAVEVLDGETRFVVNGSIVHTMPSAQARPYGIAGIRANHRLDVRVGAWSLQAGESD